MNKTKLFNSYKSKINSLLDRVKNKEITHTIVTINGKRIKCYESIEVLSNDEIKITIAKCLIKQKKCIMTINSDNIDYMFEKYNTDSWNQVLNIMNMDGTCEMNEDNQLYN